MFRFLTFILGGLAVALTATVIGLGILFGGTNKRNKQLQEQVREKDILINKRAKSINDFSAKVSSLEKDLKTHKNIKSRNASRIQGLKKQTDDLIAARASDEEKYLALENKCADLEQGIVSDAAAGNDIPSLASSPSVEKRSCSLVVLNAELPEKVDFKATPDSNRCYFLTNHQVTYEENHIVTQPSMRKIP